MSYLIWVLWHNLFSILSLLFKTHMVDLDATQLHPVLLLMVQDMVVLSLLGPLQLFLDTGWDFSNKHCIHRFDDASNDGRLLP